ncbi:MAG: chromosomal replication initiator DnaA [Alphaproteobacteria bacterium]|nr:MAG: chromosomal replication initiator DnaA [Alphaproteobacteria bacterium]
MSQLALDLPHRPALGRSAFFVSPANRDALGVIEGWAGWPEARLALVGPASSGKSHLAHVWAALPPARVMAADALDIGRVPDLAAEPLVLEDADRWVPGDAGRERVLLHLLNEFTRTGQPLLVTGRTPPARWGVALPDLATRLAAIAVAVLERPDDALLAAMLVKLFSDRQLSVSPRLIRFLARRLERSGAAAAAAVARLDAAALAENTAVTIHFARRVLGL